LDGRRIIWKAKEKVGRKENNMEGGKRRLDGRRIIWKAGREGWTEGE
jgi:hypothetical protein